jgi:hypothetical protein
MEASRAPPLGAAGGAGPGLPGSPPRAASPEGLRGASPASPSGRPPLGGPAAASRPGSAPREIAMVCEASNAARAERRSSVRRMALGSGPSSPRSRLPSASRLQPGGPGPGPGLGLGWPGGGAEGGRAGEGLAEAPPSESSSEEDDRTSDAEVPAPLWLPEFDAARNSRLASASASTGGARTGLLPPWYAGYRRLQISELQELKERPATSYMSSRKGVPTAAGVLQPTSRNALGRPGTSPAGLGSMGLGLGATQRR